METFKSLIPYAASAFAIIVGLASVTAPPLFTLARDLAVAFIVGGFAGLGVSVAVPSVVRTARRTAVIEYERDVEEARRARRSAGGVRAARSRKTAKLPAAAFPTESERTGKPI